MTCTANAIPISTHSRPRESTPRESSSLRGAGDSGGFTRGIPMGFTKLDEGIVLSSVWSEPCEIRVVWISLLAMADQYGIVHSSLPGLARSANVPIEVVQSSLKKFQSPDPFSRTKDNEGRRVEEIEGGWRLLNYEKYRRWSYSDSPDAVKKRKQRGTQGDMSPNVPTSAGHSASASVSASESSLKSEQKGNTAENAEFDEFWKLYPKKKSKGQAERAWSKIKRPVETLSVIKTALEWQRVSQDWSKEGGQYIPYPASYLNAKGWEDEPKTKTAAPKSGFWCKDNYIGDGKAIVLTEEERVAMGLDPKYPELEI